MTIERIDWADTNARRMRISFLNSLFLSLSTRFPFFQTGLTASFDSFPPLLSTTFWSYDFATAINRVMALETRIYERLMKV